jgi:hypothetical protein
LYIKIVPLV